MRLLQLSLNARDQGTVGSTAAFLESRLEEKGTIEWALRLGSNDIVKRIATLWLLNRKEGIALREPWRSAWRIIEESWNHPTVRYDLRRNEYIVKDRLSSGERSDSLVSAIVDLVAPRLVLKSYGTRERELYKIPKRPRTFHHLFRSSLSCGKTIDPSFLGLDRLMDGEFILSLANALDAAVVRGLNLARGIGWAHTHLHLRRVYHVSEPERSEETYEPDEFNQDIAPPVKLLYAVASQLIEVDSSAAQGFVSRWNRKDSPIHLRLWAAMSRDPRVTSAKAVGDFLLRLNYRLFWDVHHHPEITELRARRFSELGDSTQKRVTKRIRRGPPRRFWPENENADSDRVDEARLYWIVRELKRIEVAGGTLPQADRVWLETNIVRFSGLAEMNRIDEGFLDLPKGESLPADPVLSLDTCKDIDRLRTLDQAFTPPRSGWVDDPGELSWDWLREKGNALKVLKDFEASPSGGAEFPKVWERFGWAHSPPEDQQQETNERDLPSEACRVLELLQKLPEETLSKAIDGITHWLSAWQKYVVDLPNWSAVWYRVWPLAVAKTNGIQPLNGDSTSHTEVSLHLDRDWDHDILNTSAGKLVGVFLTGCPDLVIDSKPFDCSSELHKMRAQVVNISGRARLIAKLRMILDLEYFLKADQEWTENHLIEPLRADEDEALVLWSAIGGRRRFRGVLEIIESDMVERSTDARLDRETRRSLAFSLVVESLHALRERREPAVPYDQIQQMIRSLEAEVRTYCAETITRFVNDLSEPSDQEPDPPSREDLFLSAAKPFLVQVWPQERSLASPGVSAGLSRLPAAARGEFAEAVNAVERFLIPFDCWSMLEYGLYGNDDDEMPKLSMIEDEARAEALLGLLDRTVGTAEDSVIPLDLGDALDQIRGVAPNLPQASEYRRLETAARRAV